MGPSVRRDDAESLLDCRSPPGDDGRTLFHRRSCERRIPYAAAIVVGKDKLTTSAQNNCCRWLWVPAFAGTTLRVCWIAGHRPVMTGERSLTRRSCERRNPYAAAIIVGKDKLMTSAQNNCCRWLWVPAFAGTTLRVCWIAGHRPVMTGERSLTRRSCERRNPYAAAIIVGKDKLMTSAQNNCCRWLWVPAFAGTTLRVCTNLNRAARPRCISAAWSDTASPSSGTTR